MPVFFTYLLASFPAGLVIYWAWNNTLSVIQQSFIMWRQGVEIPLLENLGIKPKKDAAKDHAPAKPANDNPGKRKGRGGKQARTGEEGAPGE